MLLSKESIIQDVFSRREFLAMKGQWISRAGTKEFGKDEKLTLLQLQEKNPTWNAEDIIYGLHRLSEVAKENENYVFPVYSEKECIAEPEKKQVNVIYMPAKGKRKDTCVILLAGGAYGAVCTMVESIPVAAKLNELGFSCFCLNYRTATNESFVTGLLPKPLEDLAAAWEWIHSREEQFEIDATDYVVGGFSAGGHIAALWGTEAAGYGMYGVPKPQMLLLGYPLITTEHLTPVPINAMIKQGMYGAETVGEKEKKFSANRHVTTEYPKVYCALCKDDTTVPEQDFYVMEQELKKHGISYYVERGERGGHGFGLGNATEVCGWINRAMEFLEVKR